MDETSSSTATTVDSAATETAAGSESGGGEKPFSRTEFEAALAGFRKTFNGEMASMRKRLDRPAGEVAEKKKDADPSAGAFSTADWKTLRELGRLEAKVEASLGEEAFASLSEDLDALPPAQQALILRAALKLKGGTPKVEKTDQQDARTDERASGGDANKPGRDARSKASNPRGEPPQTRESSPRPKTKVEFRELKKSNPQRAEELIKDDSFNLNALPYA